jgi:hypothetical protein
LDKQYVGVCEPIQHCLQSSVIHSGDSSKKGIRKAPPDHSPDLRYLAR